MVQGVTDPFNSKDFPFPSKVSLRPVLKTWQTNAGVHPLLAGFAQDVLALEHEQPELFEASESTAYLRSEHAGTYRISQIRSGRNGAGVSNVLQRRPAQSGRCHATLLLRFRLYHGGV